MTAFYVFAQCANSDHKSCPDIIPIPEDSPPDFCGGAVCRCPCHQRSQLR